MRKINIEKSIIYAKMKKMKIFQYFSDQEIEKIASLSNILQYDKNEQIIEQNSIHPYFYAVLDGTVSVSINNNGISVYQSEILEGDVFGETGIFSNQPKTADIFAKSNTIVLQIERKNFISFIKENQTGGIKLLIFIIQSLINKLKGTNREAIVERDSDMKLEEIQYINELFKN